MRRSNSSLKRGRLEANVSTIKVHLGRYLRRVREGEEVVVLDRRHPVAKLVPFTGDQDQVEETAPVSSWQDTIRRMSEADRRRAPSKLGRSSLFYLMQDREGRE